MLIYTIVEKWAGPSPASTRKKKLSSTNTEYWVLNTTHMFNIQANGTGAKLYYVPNLYGIRSHGNYLELSDSVATLRTAFDASYEHEYMTLPVYLNDDTSASTTNIDIPASSVCYAVADDRDSTRTWLTYAEGSKSRTILVDYPLADIVYLADEGSTTSSA
jgi:hypothetical protein